LAFTANPYKFARNLLDKEWSGALKIKKARFGLAPGDNATLYKMYKMCPLLQKRLWRLLKVVYVYRKVKCQKPGRKLREYLHPRKTQGKTNSMNGNQFRTISLLNFYCFKLTN